MTGAHPVRIVRSRRWGKSCWCEGRWAGVAPGEAEVLANAESRQPRRAPVRCDSSFSAWCADKRLGGAHDLVGRDSSVPLHHGSAEPGGKQEVTPWGLTRLHAREAAPTVHDCTDDQGRPRPGALTTSRPRAGGTTDRPDPDREQYATVGRSATCPAGGRHARQPAETTMSVQATTQQSKTNEETRR